LVDELTVAGEDAITVLEHAWVRDAKAIESNSVGAAEVDKQIAFVANGEDHEVTSGDAHALDDQGAIRRTTHDDATTYLMERSIGNLNPGFHSEA